MLIKALVVTLIIGIAMVGASIEMTENGHASRKVVRIVSSLGAVLALPSIIVLMFIWRA